MSKFWIEIEALVLDGVPLNLVQGRRLAQLTEIALTRLLAQRGTATTLTSGQGSAEARTKTEKPMSMKVPSGANEARWAEELAMALLRAVDRVL